MKIIQSIETQYVQKELVYKKLEIRVNEQFEKIRQKHWFYLSRIKKPESFALKIETGREIDDFFGCTLVVNNLDQINEAKKVVYDTFNITAEKPKEPTITHKEPFSFEFDDLRLYAFVKQPENLPIEPISELIFEIQIKTFLQHAWSIATHDLIYKADEINWPKQRVAYQIKASLEQAEVTISGVNNLIALPEIAKDNYDTIKQKEILQFYNSNFIRSDLPKDLVRLCKNTQELIRNLRLNIDDLKEVLANEISVGKGTRLLNLSPFLIVLQSIINQKKQVVEEYLNSGKNQKFKIVLPKELETDTLNIQHYNNAKKLDIISALQNLV